MAARKDKKLLDGSQIVSGNDPQDIGRIRIQKGLVTDCQIAANGSGIQLNMAAR
jgi:hypothetical protein